MEEPKTERRTKLTTVLYGALGAIILAPLVIGVAWTQRRPIAREFINDELAKRGVKASYELTAVGTKLQRIERIVIGDPKNPDLTADWAEIDTNARLSGVTIKAVRASGVRVRGALIGNRLALGMLDKLLPPKSDAPFSLPNIDITLRDARMRLDTEYGPLGARLDGRGNPSAIFNGKLALVAPQLERADCTARKVTAFVDLTTRDKQIAVKGPVRADQVGCGVNRADRVTVAVDAGVSERFDVWDGNAELISDALFLSGTRLTKAVLTSDFSGAPDATSGKFNLNLATASAAGGAAGKTGIGGNFRVAQKGVPGQSVYVDGTINAQNVRPDQSTLAGLLRYGSTGNGTPAEPIVASLAHAVGRLREGSALRARFDLASEGGDGELRLNNVEAKSMSGAQLSFAGRDPLRYFWRDGGLVVASLARLTGGGFPTSDVQLAGRDGRWSGTARIAPLVSGDTRIALTPVSFALGRGGTQFETVATIDGRFGDTRFAGVELPLSMRPGATLFGGCRQIAFNSIELSGFSLDPTRLQTCLDGQQATFSAPRLAGRYQNAPFTLSGARARFNLISKAASIDSPRFEGRYGQSAFKLAGSSAQFDSVTQTVWLDALSGTGRMGHAPFTLATESVRYGARDGRLIVGSTGLTLGAKGNQTALNLDSVAGNIRGTSGTGTFAGARGNIGTIPLDLSNGNGRWRYGGNSLLLNGSLGVADHQAEPRFEPLVSNDFSLRYAADRITGQGTLVEPRTGASVSGVTLEHRLSSGTGRAVLSVDGLNFGRTLQPEQITKITLGVIANVEGTVRGQGNIRWAPQGVTSDGRFSTEGINLAAAFGPVRGMKGEIVFSDLLGLTTAPGQSVSIAEINSGVLVTDGIIKYRLLPGLKAEIEGGRWPFSGGALVLEPTVLDLSESAERRLTFRVEELDAEKFVNALELSNIAATGSFDGVIPMIFDKTGGRIVAGNLIARDGGGTLSYIGEVSKENLGTFGSIAFDALKSMQYKKLAIDLDGALDGEMITKIRFAGVNQLPIVPGRAKFPLPIKVQGLNGIPFIFNITITAPFRGLLRMATDIQDPTRLIQDQLEMDGRRQSELNAPQNTNDPDNPVQQ